MPISTQTTLAALALTLLGCSEFIDRDPCGETTCTAGETRCDESGVWTCSDVDGCPAWSVAPCASDQVCGDADQCIPKVCTPGEKRCSDGTIERCMGPGAGQWEAITTCEVAETCQDGACTATPCDTPDARTCGPDGTILVCTEALSLTLESSCDDGQACIGAGICGTHSCDDGAHECDGADKTRTCVTGPNGFRVWTLSEACEFGALCGLDGRCGTHECGPKDATGCKDGAVATCRVGSAGFLIWGEPMPCDAGSECVLGECASTSCTVDEVRCTEDGLQTCQQQDDGGSWGPALPCESDAVCVDGACTAHECEIGEISCVEGLSVTCEAGADGLRTWSDGQTCEVGAECREGVCGQDGCTEVGAVECVDDSTRSCLDGVFLLWSTPEPCPAQCLGGVCGSNECEPGEVKCTDNLVSGCITNLDGFQVFTEPTACPHDAMICGDGGCTFEGEFQLWDEPTIGRTSVTATAAGGFAAVWAAPEGSSFPVRLGAFAAAGNPLLDPIDVSGAVGVNLPWPSATTLDTGAIQLAWLNAGSASMITRRISAEGAFGDPIAVPGLLSLPPSPWPDVAAFGESEAIVVRVEGSESPPAQRVVYNVISELPSDPTFLGLDTDSGELVTSVDAVSRSDGGVWVIWSAVDASGARSLRLQAILPSGAPADNVLTVAAGGSVDRAVLATQTDGTLVAAWDDDGVIMARPVAPLGAVSTLHPADSTGNSEPSLVASGVGYLVVWQGPDESDTGIFSRTLGADAVPNGPVVQLNTTTDGSQAGARAAVIEDGNIVVVWRDSIGQNARVTARMLTP